MREELLTLLRQAEVAVRAQQLDAATYLGARCGVARRMRTAAPAKEAEEFAP
jgi:hypothetical protein